MRTDNQREGSAPPPRITAGEILQEPCPRKHETRTRQEQRRSSAAVPAAPVQGPTDADGDRREEGREHAAQHSPHDRGYRRPGRVSGHPERYGHQEGAGHINHPRQHTGANYCTQEQESHGQEPVDRGHERPCPTEDGARGNPPMKQPGETQQTQPVGHDVPRERAPTHVHTAGVRQHRRQQQRPRQDPPVGLKPHAPDKTHHPRYPDDRHGVPLRRSEAPVHEEGGERTEPEQHAAHLLRRPAQQLLRPGVPHRESAVHDSEGLQ